MCLCRMSYNPTRYPRYIPEAYCLCKGCLIGPRGEESNRFRSAPVFSPSVILRRTGSCVGGRHSYVERYVSIAVGCTCVPLLEKQRSDPKSNQSSARTEAKAKQLVSAGEKVWRTQSHSAADGLFSPVTDSCFNGLYLWSLSSFKTLWMIQYVAQTDLHLSLWYLICLSLK